MNERAQSTWRKSTRSGAQSNCVELRHGLDAVRDSKNPSGPVLVADLGALVAAVRSGQLG
jgi:hypothetical protein